MCSGNNRVCEALDIVRRAKALGDYDSNIVGMAAEIIAEEKFNMVKTKPGAKKIDGHLPAGESVQVKGWSCSRIQKYGAGTFLRIPPDGIDKLLVILIYSRLAEYETLYFGDYNKVGTISPLKGKDTRVVRLDSLKNQEEINKILQKIASSQN